MAEQYLLLEVGVMFAALATVGAVARRLDLSVIPFYIFAGILLGEHVLGRVGSYVLERVALVDAEAPYVHVSAFVEVGAELGIVFLLFFLGLEFNLDRLLGSKELIGKAGTVDLAINFGAGLALGYLLFGDPLPAFLVAGIVYISSSAIITKSLIDLGWIANPESAPMLGTLVYEDLFIAVYLAVATALVLGGGDVSQASQSVAIAVGFILLLLAFVYLSTGVLQRVLDVESHESLVLRTVGLTVLIAGAALAVNVSEAVAAFFVGMAVSETDFVDDVEELLEPVRDVFAAVFFFWIGLETDPVLVAGVAALVAAAVVATTPTKLVSGFLGGRVYGLNARRSTRVGLGMVTRGEFSLIVAAVALDGAGGALSPEVASAINAFAVGYVLVMSVLGTVLMQYSAPFERFVVRRVGG